MTRSGIVLRLGCCGLLLAVLAALWLQDHSGALPLGLFNEGRRAYALLSLACAVGAVGGVGVFVVELARGRANALGRGLRGALVALVLLEILLWTLDVTLVSRGGARLGGPYREVRSPGGEWVALKKPHLGSPFGFRTSEPHPRRSSARRILFLGDSYTEGSGRALDCNYPEVAARTVSRMLGVPIGAMNAGVAGYGPEEAARLLRLLIEEGFQFDAVVHSLFLENDFTDDLPGTERRVVAGIPFRFPESRFMRLFHPLNTRAFRYAIFLQRTSRLVRRTDAVRRDPGACDLAPAALAAVAPQLRSLVLRRLDANYAAGARIAPEGVVAAASAMRASAAALGAPFVVVVFPDRLLVDAELRGRLGEALGDGHDLGRLRRIVEQRFQTFDVIDATPALQGGSENYRDSDTHLSDLGNVRAGQFVGARLAEILAERGFPPRRR